MLPCRCVGRVRVRCVAAFAVSSKRPMTHSLAICLCTLPHLAVHRPSSSSPPLSASAEPDSLRLFQEDLKDDDHELVIATCGRILNVAQLLGQQRTRNELIPFLLEYVEQDSDEAHTVIAKHLGDFTEVSPMAALFASRRLADTIALSAADSLARSASTACRWFCERVYPSSSPRKAVQ